MSSRPDYAQKMVGWYDPPQLLRTAGLVLVSQQFALHADNREIQALAAPKAGVHDYSADPAIQDLWIDFVADSGDGFNSTYAVASELAKDRIAIVSTGSAPDVLKSGELERGRILVFGGDLVYPTPTGQGYDDRLINPYRDAFGADEKSWPEVWALPGNHDWYDSLSVFRRLFCTKQDFGPWRTRQKMSYFAVKLPHDWWLFGIDLQLLHEIDQQQLWYFQEVIKTMGPNDRIILVSPEPYWVDHAPQAFGSSGFVKSLLTRLLDSIGGRLRLAIAGDLHHYQRLSDHQSRTHFITCGTGGAFLHPTHAVNLTPPAGFTLQKSYPDVDRSRRLSRYNFYFLYRNPLFGIVPALFYLLVAWSTGLNIGEKFGRVELRELGEIGLWEFWEAIRVGLHSAILSPIGMALYLFIFAGFIVFTQSKSEKFRWIAGSLHGFSHVVVGFLIFWGTSYFCITVLGLVPKSVSQYLLAGVMIMAGGWIAGSVLMGIYLWVSLNLFREHVTEAFSSLRIQDWKGFLRMHLSANGELDVYFLGIEHVPRYWQKKPAGALGPEWVPNDRKATSARLEDHVKIKP